MKIFSFNIIFFACVINSYNCQSRASYIKVWEFTYLYPAYVSTYAVIDSTRGKKINYVNRYFLLINYKEDKRTDKIIDKLADSIYKAKKLNGDNYLTLIFFKESNSTNEELLKKNQKYITKYNIDDDLVYTYVWDIKSNLYGVRFKYKNGLIIEPKGHIMVKDPD